MKTLLITIIMMTLIIGCSSSSTTSRKGNWQERSVTNKSCNSDPRKNGGATYGFPQRWFGCP